MVLIDVDLINLVRDINYFRPLAGIMVLIRWQKGVYYEDNYNYFRPLAGIMVLIYAYAY